MSERSFVHLNLETGYSLLDSTCKVDDVVKTAVAQGSPAVAMTDRGVLYGAVEFYKKARSAGIKPILGCKMYVTPDGIPMTERKTGRGGNQGHHLVLLAENDEGYANLCKLVSLSWLEGFYYKPRIDLDCLARHAGGLIGLSGGFKGEVTSYCAEGRLEEAEAAARRYGEILGEQQFFIELQDHGLETQPALNEALRTVAGRAGLPLVATNDVHYLEAEHYEAHDVMVCLQGQTVFHDPDRMRYQSQELYMKSPEAMWALFEDTPEALENTLRIAERCHVELRLGVDLHFPIYETPDGMDQEAYLIELAEEGLQAKYGIRSLAEPRDEAEKRVCDRFFHELEVIKQTGFLNYFLVVWDFIRFARDQRIPVGPGRGSGAGSLFAYALGITGIDPLQYDLIFERFLNPERVSPPDFDIDFCQARREEVIHYVRNKYGLENVAQIITFGTLGAKTVIRDVGRVLEVPFQECDRLAKLIPEEPGMTLAKAEEQNPEFKNAVKEDESARRIMSYARILEGLPRNPGTHAAGVVIGEKPLIELIPLSLDKDKEVVTQFEMKPLEETGLLKMDFLGLKTLTVLQEAVDNIRETRGVEVDLENLPMDDPETFALLNRADTVGVFQVESSGMQDLLRRIELQQFEELIAIIALYRPGPMNMLDDYVGRKKGNIEMRYDHPLLEPILETTYGVMIYQEQVQRAANVLAGFSLAAGDMLRRAMGKKIPAEMAKQKDAFIQGCWETNKIPERTAQKIFDNIERFAGYGFNKSHSAAYAIVSYQTAYLKAHYPPEFMAALLSSEMGNSDKLPKLIKETADEMGIEVLPPDVNESWTRFRPMSEKTIRFGLAGIKNVGVGAVEALVAEREEHGPYAGLLDFCSRVDPHSVNRKALESLVRGGAFDFTKQGRGRLFDGVEFAMNRAASSLRDKAAGQTSLFDLMDGGAPEQAGGDEELPEGPDWPVLKMLAEEKELLGFYISGHPMDSFTWQLEGFRTHTLGQLAEVPHRETVRVGGLVVEYQKRFTRKEQKPMGLFWLEDLDASVEAMIFDQAFLNSGVHLRDNAPVMITAEVSHKEGHTKLYAQEVVPLGDVGRRLAGRIILHMPSDQAQEARLVAIRELLAEHPGTTPVQICLHCPGGEKIVIRASSALTVCASPALFEALDAILGKGKSQLVVPRPEPVRRTFGGRGDSPQSISA